MTDSQDICDIGQLLCLCILQITLRSMMFCTCTRLKCFLSFIFFVQLDCFDTIYFFLSEYNYSTTKTICLVRLANCTFSKISYITLIN